MGSIYAEFLLGLYGQRLEDMAFQSFYKNHKLVTKYLNLYVKFDRWYIVFIDEEVGGTHLRVSGAPQSLHYESQGREFTYPVETIPYSHPLGLCLDKKLEKVQEIIHPNQKDLNVGISFSFEKKAKLNFFLPFGRGAEPIISVGSHQVSQHLAFNDHFKVISDCERQ